MKKEYVNIAYKYKYKYCRYLGITFQVANFMKVLIF